MQAIEQVETKEEPVGYAAQLGVGLRKTPWIRPGETVTIEGLSQVLTLEVRDDVILPGLLPVCGARGGG